MYSLLLRLIRSAFLTYHSLCRSALCGVLSLASIGLNTPVIAQAIHSSGKYPSDTAGSVLRTASVVRDANLHVNRINQVHHAFPELNGTGIAVSVKETAYDPNDIDWRGRHRSSGTAATEGLPHATTMATLLAGAGNSAPFARGVAWGAQLSSASFDNLLPDDNYEALGVSVQNHSYGTQIESFYGAEAQAYDQNTNDLPTLLHVFSAGNGGLSTDSLGTYWSVPGWANLTGNYKQAKNILTVGAVDRRGQIDSLISRGPAHDGRIKPELVAYSTEGSSGAAALVSGTAALLQQTYRQRHGALPPSALLKAVLINSARDLGALGPDLLSGYGNLDAYRAVQAIRNRDYFRVTVKNQQEATLTVTVPPDAVNLKVTLAWNDAAGDINANTALVNDLDLQLVHEASGEQWQPWVLSHYPHVDSLSQPARRGVDRLNPVEQITVAQPEAGEYTICLLGAAVPTGAQAGYVVVQWETANQFTWTSPTGSDNLPQDGINQGAFRWWTTYGEDASGELAIRLGSDQRWQTIEEAVDLSTGYYAWQPPLVFSEARVRMTINDAEYLSDTFTVSRSLHPTVGFSCGDSALLQWNRVPTADGYTLYTLGEQYMETATTVADTFAVLSLPTESAWYAVAPQQTDREGIRSEAVDLRGAGVSCYVANFSAGVNERAEVSLTLDLNATYQLREVQFERWDGTGFQPLARTAVSENLLQEYVDSTAEQGRNQYRARLQFVNGAEVLTESATVYYLTDQPVLVFPNPVVQSQPLSVFTRVWEGETATIILYNALGQPVLTQTLKSEREVVTTSSLVPGWYAFVILANKQRFNGRFMVR